MTQTTYKAFVDRMIGKYEGPYGWNRKDPGGPTKYGITCYDLAEHRGQKMDSMERWAPLVAAMTLDEAEAIYKTKYATAIRYDDLPAGVDSCMMDYAVNSGNGRSILVARRLVGVTAGSNARVDQPLLDAIKKVDPNKFIDLMCDERLRFMHAIRNGDAWAEFGHGWGSRVADLRAYDHHLATTADSTKVTLPAPEAPDLTKVVQPKAIHVPKTATKTTLGTAGASGATAHASGLPLWQTACIVGGVLIAGIVYEAYHDHAATVANNTVHI